MLSDDDVFQILWSAYLNGSAEKNAEVGGIEREVRQEIMKVRHYNKSKTKLNRNTITNSRDSQGSKDLFREKTSYPVSSHRSRIKSGNRVTEKVNDSDNKLESISNRDNKSTHRLVSQFDRDYLTGDKKSHITNTMLNRCAFGKTITPITTISATKTATAVTASSVKSKASSRFKKSCAFILKGIPCPRGNECRFEHGYCL